MTVEDGPWRLAPATLSISQDAVHVWRASLDQHADVVNQLEKVLTEEEADRARRHHFDAGRRHFVVARGVLRTILSRYIGCAPGELGFWHNACGKPFLAFPSGHVSLHFNLSHSGSLALLAITRHRHIGVDLERVRTDVARERIAEHMFSPAETARLRALPLDRQPEAFFQCWTRKEAYIKARGQGLSIPLRQFTVPVDPDEPVRLVEVDPDPTAPSSWYLCDLFPGEGFMAALAVEGLGWQLECWQWQSDHLC
jgi:4'-phosphopantetheinyl transferase